MQKVPGLCKLWLLGVRVLEYVLLTGTKAGSTPLARTLLVFTQARIQIQLGIGLGFGKG